MIATLTTIFTLMHRVGAEWAQEMIRCSLKVGLGPVTFDPLLVVSSCAVRTTHRDRKGTGHF